MTVPEYKRSRELLDRARRLMPGGVNSPVRAFSSVGGDPFFVRWGSGAHIRDVDDNDYIDYVASWGPLILGHAHEHVMQAISEALARGTSFGATTEAEVELAAEIQTFFPSMERMRLVNSGTEATMSAIRLARAATSRSGLVKCLGCYHGHVDALLVAAGSGVATLGIPGSAGVPHHVVRETFLVPFNDLEALQKLLKKKGAEIACFIVEPVAGNMGCVPPAEGYLQEVRRLTSRHGVLLILDEVMSGFRVDRGGAQRRYGVVPDITTLGKIVGGGLPVGAYGGRADLMARVAPEGPVYQAGTLSGNPLAVAAGLSTLRFLAAEEAAGRDPYARLELMSRRLQEGISGAADEAGMALQINRVGSMFTVFFTSTPVTDFRSAQESDVARFRVFFRSMLESGISLPPSQFETAFVSLAHTERDIQNTVEAASRAFRTMRG